VSRSLRALRLLLAVLIALAAPAAPAVAPVRASALLDDVPARAAARSAAGTYRPPVGGALVVLRAFQPPPTPYAAGHRGVDLALSSPVVSAAGSGVVSFAGVVVDRGVVVIRHPDGVSTEYEPVTASVTQGAPVSVGQAIGTVSGVHAGCSAPCLHWGARRNGTYLDPMLLLRPLGVVRLLPDG